MKPLPWFAPSLALIVPRALGRRSSLASSESAIRKLVDQQTKAWNRGDARRYAQSFEKDGWFTNILGQVYSGHDAFEQRHAEIFATVFKGSHLRQTVRRVRFLQPDAALVDVDTEMTGFQALPPGVCADANGVLRTRLEQVMLRQRGKWWVVAYHNVDVKPLPKTK